MGAVVQRLIFKESTFEKNLKQVDNDNILVIPVETIEGQKGTVGSMIKGQKLTIIVNVASKWAFAHKSYVELVNVYEEYNQYGMQVLAFPCSQFLE